MDCGGPATLAQLSPFVAHAAEGGGAHAELHAAAPPVGGSPPRRDSDLDTPNFSDAATSDGGDDAHSRHESGEHASGRTSRRSSITGLSRTADGLSAPLALRPIIRKPNNATASAKKRRKAHRIVWEESETREVLEYHLSPEERTYKLRTTEARHDDFHHHPAGKRAGNLVAHVFVRWGGGPAAYAHCGTTPTHGLTICSSLYCVEFQPPAGLL